MADHTFYLGRIYDPVKQKITGETVQYDPADLTTHGFVVGMTGSGKTGLCIDILEEAALQGIPAIAIDPKGDLTNLVLHFPNLAPTDFRPWIDPEIARREGQTIDQAAQEASQTWRKGLEEWGIKDERMKKLASAVEYTIYTPGSDSGNPVNILSSLAAPALDWNANREILREKITSTVTALLGLVGYTDVDPIRSREHILLANLLENSWSKGKEIELQELILQAENPPIEKLGAFDVETFFPTKDRRELAVTLNNFLAAPSFEAWRTGESLDVQNLLFSKDGHPRHSIFYLAHLSDQEKMFFVTLLLSSIEAWMRTQSGVTSLRAILYMDEIFGYLPPVAAPPSKAPLLRMLKQARAFGLGILLATQNPVDVDYKGLSNMGSWFIGKLQTDQDKQRLLDGLVGAAGGISRSALDKLISSLGKRVFILHNVHEKKPVMFYTRWTMNFLAGPLTREQIPELIRLSHANQKVERASVLKVDGIATPAGSAGTAGLNLGKSLNATSTKPSVPSGIREYFLVQNLSLPEAFSASQKPMIPGAAIQGIVYKPGLTALAQVRLLDRKLGVDMEIKRAILDPNPDKRGVIRWEQFGFGSESIENAEVNPVDPATFSQLVQPLNDNRTMAAIQKDFTDWVYRNTAVTAKANQALKVYAGPDVSQGEFMKSCADAASIGSEAEIAKVNAQLDRQISTLESKLNREERELKEDESDLQHRKLEELGTHAENVFSLFGGRRSSRRISSSLSKRRLTENAKADVEESVGTISEYKRQLDELKLKRDDAAREIKERWGNRVNEITETKINPKKTDIYISIFGVAWMPFYIVKAGNELIELAAFKPNS